MTVEDLKTVISSLHEINPMLGHRVCRLGITHPEITKCRCRRLQRLPWRFVEMMAANVEIEIPLVGTVREFTHMKN